MIRLNLIEEATRLKAQRVRGILYFISFLVPLFFLTSEIQAELIQGNHYINQEVGLSFSKPESWQFISLKKAVKSTIQQSPTNKKAELEKVEEGFVKLKSSTKMDPVIVVKYPEPYSGFNPTFQIYLEPHDLKRNDMLIEFMRIYLDTQRKRYDAFKITTTPEPAYFAGHKAGYAEATAIRGVRNGEKIKFTCRLWVVPRGGMAFIVVMFKPFEKNDAIDKEFFNLLISTRIWE